MDLVAAALSPAHAGNTLAPGGTEARNMACGTLRGVVSAQHALVAALRGHEADPAAAGRCVAWLLRASSHCFCECQRVEPGWPCLLSSVENSTGQVPKGQGCHAVQRCNASYVQACVHLSICTYVRGVREGHHPPECHAAATDFPIHVCRCAIGFDRLLAALAEALGAAAIARDTFNPTRGPRPVAMFGEAQLLAGLSRMCTGEAMKHVDQVRASPRAEGSVNGSRCIIISAADGNPPHASPANCRRRQGACVPT